VGTAADRWRFETGDRSDDRPGSFSKATLEQDQGPHPENQRRFFGNGSIPRPSCFAADEPELSSNRPTGAFLFRVPTLRQYEVRTLPIERRGHDSGLWLRIRSFRSPLPRLSVHSAPYHQLLAGRCTEVQLHGKSCLPLRSFAVANTAAAIR
jgi:hypothetical protein